MSESSAALLELSPDDCLPTLAALGNVNSPDQEPILGIAMQPTPLSKVWVAQISSDKASIDRFIARTIAKIAGVKLVSRERFDEKFRFYVVIDDTDPQTMEEVFNVENELHGRFNGDDLEFEVLPGEELQSVLPTGAVELWRAA